MNRPIFLSCSVLRVFFVVVSLTVTVSSLPSSSSSSPLTTEFQLRSQFLADSFVCSYYSQPLGIFPSEALWQSGNTIETLSNLMLELSGIPSTYNDLIYNSYLRNPPVVDTCFDDHQWWLLGWVRAYQLTGNTLYIERAAQIFDYVIANGWDTTVCNGGVLWCPPPTSPYKNAITNDLFLTSAMELFPYANLVNKSSTFYLDWGIQSWKWLESSGIINSNNLLNDGLNSQTGSCTNNNGTTWTYNQGVLLDGLALLSQGTGNDTILSVAQTIATSVFTNLVTGNGILVEPCSNCDNDQHIFKGIFIRHLSKLIEYTNDPTFNTKGSTFILNNALSMLSSASCSTASMYGLHWEGPTCSDNSVSSTTAALDLLVAAITASKSISSTTSIDLSTTLLANFTSLGLGTCIDDNNNTMPSCVSTLNVSEHDCQTYAQTQFTQIAGYNFQVICEIASTLCQIYSSQASTNTCGKGWTYVPGTATQITSTRPTPANLCVVYSS